MLLFILWRHTTSELWTPVQFPLHCYTVLLLLALLTFSHTITVFHSICSYLCLQQTGEIDNLIVSWVQSAWLCCVQVTLLLVEDAPTRIVNGTLAGVLWSYQASPSQVWLFPTGSINLGFLLRERLSTMLIIPSSWGSQLGGYPARISGPAPGPPPSTALLPIYSPRRENLKTRSIFHGTYYEQLPSSPRDQEDPEALPGTLPERGITSEGLLHHHACLRSDVWVVYLGLRVHSSS
jgi:hypothetical protein